MKKLIATAAVAMSLVHTPANAWFFFFLPGSVTSAISDKLTGAEGENCVDTNAKVGDQINIPGKGRATVKSLSGTSTRCTTSAYPIRALLDFNTPASPPPAPVAFVRTQTEGYRCLPSDTRIGADFYDSTGDRGLVKSVSKNPAACVGETPIQALVVFDATPATKQEIEGLAQAAVAQPTPVSPQAQTLPSPILQDHGSARLRALSKLLEDGLINSDDYNAKKREILGAM